MGESGFAGEIDDDLDCDGWCEECDDDDGDVKLDSGEWLCRACLAKRCNELLAAAKPLAWTKERPTEPGWYWCRRKGCHEPTTVLVEPEDVQDDHPDFDAVFFAPREWAGPIPEPKEHA